MSAAQPGELRDALAEVTQAHRNMGIRDGAWACFCSQRFSDLAAWLAHQADALLPVVTAYAERLARERAAEELRAAAMEVGGMDTPGYVRAKLRARAAALTADDQPVQP